MKKYTIIIPTLNEEAIIAEAVQAAVSLGSQVEVIVADGGSQDRTVAFAEAAGATVVAAPRGRGPQCNAGAAAAHGAILIFLHADTRLPDDVIGLLETWFSAPRVQIAKFRLSFDIDDLVLDLAAKCMWYDTRLTSYGDQGIVIRRTFFEALGGFPAWPLFEDVRLFERARERTSVVVLPARVVTSARRFQANGAIPQLVRDLGLWIEYVAGVSPFEIAARYK
ncbi:TIGR04283 family arsenosugar biosynthesis glycosyltransferase [Candidatus Chloroploca sp. M-50]|uniref:4,4'-diaponeurosporenoate glycosyltransferase n=1 Tax=Candidatus Chloroploca mongolica TaxID=2528176 RepID=A0ABS4DET5_9CHLR|nr:TIGR04283 family arsenosugar biosynthesis glycosyltransferase [Candidatus Chloroploca mongolica]MBP1467936.1 TIGR04283 family arsenosugar biosynthesis glycosyltransferase [Candidatus Chloroploca mongolica]